jgi:hypothetical protein
MHRDVLMWRVGDMAGFCHFNDNDERIVFEINLFGINFQLKQGIFPSTMAN